MRHLVDDKTVIKARGLFSFAKSWCIDRRRSGSTGLSLKRAQTDRRDRGDVQTSVLGHERWFCADFSFAPKAEDRGGGAATGSWRRSSLLCRWPWICNYEARFFALALVAAVTPSGRQDLHSEPQPRRLQRLRVIYRARGHFDTSKSLRATRSVKRRHISSKRRRESGVRQDHHRSVLRAKISK